MNNNSLYYVKKIEKNAGCMRHIIQILLGVATSYSPVNNWF